MQIHKSSSSRHWKNGRLVDGIDITGGIDITTGVDINNKSSSSPKAFLTIHDPVKHTIENLTTDDIESYMDNLPNNVQKSENNLKKTISQHHGTPSRKKKKKQIRKKTNKRKRKKQKQKRK
jgi:hypothetical protein